MNPEKLSNKLGLTTTGTLLATGSRLPRGGALFTVFEYDGTYGITSTGWRRCA